MKNKSQHYPMLALLSLSILNGCTPYSESFDCQPGQGIGCKSLSQVNQMLEEGKLPLRDEGEDIHEQSRAIKRSTRNEDQRDTLIEARNEQGPIHILPYNTEAKRDAQLRVWIAAYEDDEGIYHASSYVYAAIKKHPTE